MKAEEKIIGEGAAITFTVLLSLVLAVVGFASLSQATFGVGVIGVACLLAILARIAQAERHHRER